MTRGQDMSTSGSMGLSGGDPQAFLQQRATQVRYFVIGLVFLVGSALIWPLLGRGLSNLQFMPHTFCYLGNRTLIITHLVSDLLIGISYVVISLTLIYLVRASTGKIPFHWIFLAFGMFIIACGGTHFMEAVTLWYPIYWTSAYVKVVTALASVATAIALPLVMPSILANVRTLRQSESREVALRKANEELSAANEKLQELDRLRRRFVAQTAANLGDWEWEIGTGEVRWSSEVEDMHGFARGSFQGRFEEWVSTVHPDDRERVQATIGAAIANKSDYDIEYRTIWPDGRTYWIAGRGATEYGKNGEPLRMAGMCMDITSRRRTEEALRKGEKLAAAGRLAATIAHEINNPLEAVTNLLFLARADRSGESRRELLDLADRELQRVSHITRQTLGFYRETSTPVMLDVTEILKSVLDIFQGKLNSKAIKTTIEVKEYVNIRGVPGELRQVFSNLLNNAIDASPAGSEIRIRIKQLGSAVRVMMADHGPGIAKEARGQIFEPFFTTKKDVGTGLGLWICKQIVENHGGRIRFRSSVDHQNSGTVFVVHLTEGGQARSTVA